MDKEQIKLSLMTMREQLVMMKTDLQSLLLTDIAKETLRRTYIQFVSGAIDFALTNLTNLYDKYFEE